MVDRAVLERLADSLPETGEPGYADRMALRRALAPDALLRLEELAARRVYPVWTASFEDDDLPREVLAAALADPDSVTAQLGELKTHLDEQFLEGDEYFPAIYAGFASWAVARDAAHTVEPVGNGELEVPPEQWSPSFFASLAEAGGATWEDVGDNDRRRDFWRWYLLEAVPSVD